MLAQSPFVNSLCTALLILHVHSVSTAPQSPLCSCLRSDKYSILLYLMYDMEFSKFQYEAVRFEQFPPTTVDNKSIRVLAVFLCQRWVESLLLIDNWHFNNKGEARDRV